MDGGHQAATICRERERERERERVQQRAGGGGAANGETPLQIGIFKICMPGGQELLETVAKGECEQGKKGGNKRVKHSKNRCIQFSKKG